MKYIIKYRVIVIEVAILLFFMIYNVLTNIYDISSFEKFTASYFSLKKEYELLDKAMVIFNTTPVIIFFFCHGTYLYKEWSIDNIYALVRYKKRTHIYLKNVIHILLLALFMASVFIILLYTVYTYKGGHLNRNTCYIISIALNTVAVYYYITMVFSLISIRYGSLYGCFATFLIWSFSVVLSLYFIYKTKSHSLLFILRLIIPGINLFYCVKTGITNITVILIPVIQIFALILSMVLIIKKIDIGLTDREAE